METLTKGHKVSISRPSTCGGENLLRYFTDFLGVKVTLKLRSEEIELLAFGAS
jgi:hypothetical protein